MLLYNSISDYLNSLSEKGSPERKELIKFLLDNADLSGEDRFNLTQEYTTDWDVVPQEFSPFGDISIDVSN